MIINRTIFIALTFLPTICLSELKQDDINIVHFLNDAETLAQTKITEPTLSARLYTLTNPGECAQDKASCPTVNLYVAVSNFGEYPDQNVFVLKESYAWTFEKWTHIPKRDEQKQIGSFIVKRKYLVNNEWRFERLEITADPWHIESHPVRKAK